MRLLIGKSNFCGNMDGNNVTPASGSYAVELNARPIELKAPKFSRKEARTISSLMMPDERMLVLATERRLHGAWLNPTIILVTDRKMVVVNRKYFRLKSDISFIKHESIVSFRVAHSLLFSSIKIRQQGNSDSSKEFNGKYEGEIRGFSRGDADSLARAINYVSHIKESMGNPQLFREMDAKPEAGASVYERSKELPSVVPDWAYAHGVQDRMPSAVPIKPSSIDEYCSAPIELAHSLESTAETPANGGDGHEKTPINPDELLIFKCRRLVGSVEQEEAPAPVWSGSYPEPNELLSSTVRRASASSVLNSVLDMVHLHY